MSRPGPLLLALLATAPLAEAQAQLTIRVTSVPAATAAGDTIYIAGTFNNWMPAARGYALERQGDHYVITLPAPAQGPIEFKFTLGSWARVETDSAGGDVANRTFLVSAQPVTLNTTIAGWRRGPPPERISTANASVALIDSIRMPQLGRTRRFWIYLPPDYRTSHRRYPVLYMHDGQNVFDDKTSYAGEWRVDETLDSLHAAGDRGIIVVAVDHGGQLRIPEYSPWANRFGPAEGDQYVDFLVRTLKPWVDRRFRTLPDRLNTGIAGSSMGGLISLYAALKYPEVFGKAGVFSPSLWVAPAIYDMAAHARTRARNRIYMISGALEGAADEERGVHQRNQERMAEALMARGFRADRDLISRVAPDGTHSETFWRREFPTVYQWLFQWERRP